MERYRGRMVVTEVWPFLPTMFDNSVDSAWPHKKGSPNGPLVVIFTWEGKENDSVWIKQLKTALDEIRRTALQEGCTTPDAPVYYNTCLSDVTGPEDIYRHNLPDLSAIRNIYDPDDVMSLTGGFRIPLGPPIADGSYKITNAEGKVAIGACKLPGLVGSDKPHSTVRDFPFRSFAWFTNVIFFCLVQDTRTRGGRNVRSFHRGD